MIQLYEHQKQVLDLLANHKSYGLFMEQGTGKTITILSHIRQLLIAGNVNSSDKVLIVAPKSACGAWSRDIALFDKPFIEWANTNIEVINYDKVWRGGKSNKYATQKWKVVVFDESHYLKNRGRKRTDFCLE